MYYYFEETQYAILILNWNYCGQYDKLPSADFVTKKIVLWASLKDGY